MVSELQKREVKKVIESKGKTLLSRKPNAFSVTFNLSSNTDLPDSFDYVRNLKEIIAILERETDGQIELISEVTPKIDPTKEPFIAESDVDYIDGLEGVTLKVKYHINIPTTNKKVLCLEGTILTIEYAGKVEVINLAESSRLKVIKAMMENKGQRMTIKDFADNLQMNIDTFRENRDRIKDELLKRFNTSSSTDFFVSKKSRDGFIDIADDVEVKII